MDDLISRQDAIDAINKAFERVFAWDGTGPLGDKVLENVPSAQPEIVRCKECKYGVQDEDKRWYCRGLGCQVGEADGSGYCADAERRTDE